MGDRSDLWGDASDVFGHMSEALTHGHFPIALEPREVACEELERGLFAFQHALAVLVRFREASAFQACERGCFRSDIAVEEFPWAVVCSEGECAGRLAWFHPKIVSVETGEFGREVV